MRAFGEDVGAIEPCATMTFASRTTSRAIVESVAVRDGVAT